MSTITWMAEFYPIPASEVTTLQGAIDHSRLKFRGTSPENLERHGLTHEYGVLLNEDQSDWFEFNVDVCAFCTLYVDCEQCPIAYLHDDEAVREEGCHAIHSTWNEWYKSGDPQPMLDLLDKIEASLAEKEKAAP